ncbi:hypothetical protein [Phocaeicola sartorii]|uniref:hypothetical protein n=1 Tax=Phocaeicola sartorii TaxID=671267 RepID=UPI001F55D980|nr:hypothetical protein [Phocaeicola sartorii]
MAQNFYSTPLINDFDAIKGDTNSPDTLSTEIKHGIQSPLLSTAQHFYKEVKPHYNLREPKGDKPTMIHFVCFINKKQVRISTGYKVYPKQWNKIQAITSRLLSGLDNTNNIILNNKIDEMNIRFTEYINYICNNNTELNSNTLKQYIIKRIDLMKLVVFNIQLSHGMKIEKGTLHFIVEVPANHLPFDSIYSKSRLKNCLLARGIDISGHESILTSAYFD